MDSFWEYHTSSFSIREGMLNQLSIPHDEIKTFLNDAGDKGWELVSITPIEGKGQGGTHALFVTLKRRKVG